MTKALNSILFICGMVLAMTLMGMSVRRYISARHEICESIEQKLSHTMDRIEDDLLVQYNQPVSKMRQKG